MSAKTSPARIEAFFRALAETGNRTIAAERAKVSQSWVTLHRSTDPDFRARMEAAVRGARERLRAAAGGDGGVKPASGWGSLDGEELVVRGGNGRRTQIARARLRQWTPRAEDRFLAVLAATCNVKAACAAVGLTAVSAYAHRQRWPRFMERWRAAVDTGYLRIQTGLVEHAGSMFCSAELPPEIDLPPMSIEQAMQVLWMHQNEVRGIGRKPGRWQRTRNFDEVRAGILRKVEAILAAEAAESAVPAETLAADRAEWARRRGGGED